MLQFEGFIVFYLVASCVTGYRFFQQRIPNGDRVINPCDGSIWQGVGHENYAGGGVRNPFGKAFESGGKTWTAALCQADSDGDGRTNGEELGDPQCLWKPGNTPARVTNITHPGICDPYDSAKCQGQFLDCGKKKEFDCPAINSPDVRSANFTLPKNTSVPAKETNLMCTFFKLPDDQLYDIIASKPLIDNADVMHHMTIMGCMGLDDSVVGGVHECTMIDEKCMDVLAMWTFGMEGYCQPNWKGKRFGKGRSHWMVIQYHWTNPEKRTDYTDGSGVQLYYTPKLRLYNEAVFVLGDTAIFIPPNSKKHVVDTICTAEGTRRSFYADVYISSILFHMHYKGTRMWMKQYRNGELIRTLDENPFSYENPILHNFDDNPIIFKRGDEIRMRCEFNTEDFDDWVFYGDSTYDEMCFAIINYYPESGAQDCYSFHNSMEWEFNRNNCTQWYIEVIQDELIATADLFRLACDLDNPNNCTRECYLYTELLIRRHPMCFPRESNVYAHKYFYSNLLKYNLWYRNSNNNFKYGNLHEEVALAFRGCDHYPPVFP